MTNPHAFPAFITLATSRSERRIDDASSEDALIAAIAFGRDEAAFERVYAAHRRAVAAAARHICRDDAVADDITQQTFLALWQRATRLAGRSVRLRSWLVTVARNAAIDHLRAQQPCAPLEEADGIASTATSPEDAAIARASAAALAPALALLAPEQRAVIERRYFAGETFAAIAARTGEPLSTVKSRARLALDHLRGRLAG